jgi:hypothetical protein
MRLKPSGALNTVADLPEGHKLAREMAVCDGVEAAEVMRFVGGRWELSARYTPDQFDSAGNFIEKLSERAR